MPDSEANISIPDAPVTDAPVTGVVFFFCAMLMLLGGCSADSTDGAGWRFETDGEVLSSPAVSGGTVYIGSVDGSLYAVE